MTPLPPQGSDDFRSIIGIRALRYAIEPPAWHDNAACRGFGPEVFFDNASTPNPIALALCEACSVAEQCHDAAMVAPDGRPEPDGTWAATTVADRRALARDQAA